MQKYFFILISLFFFTQDLLAQGKVKVYDDYEAFKDLLQTESDSTYVINFWATWCKPCVAELPYFEDLHDHFQHEKVKVILVSLDFKRKIETKLKPFIKKNSLKSEVVVMADPKMNDWIGQVDDDWSGTIPATLVFNKAYYSFTEGEFDSADQLKDLVKQFLN